MYKDIFTIRVGNSSRVTVIQYKDLCISYAISVLEPGLRRHSCRYTLHA